jgi:hypothetical protein
LTWDLQAGHPGARADPAIVATAIAVVTLAAWMYGLLGVKPHDELPPRIWDPFRMSIAPLMPPPLHGSQMS